MKKLLLILFMVFAIAFTAFADDKVETLRFTYKQDAATLSVMSGWQLHWSDVSGSGYVKALDVPKPAAPGPSFQTEAALTVTGNPGDTVTKYFVLRAVDAAGNATGWSNEVSIGFDIPIVMNPPYEFTVEVIVQPQ
jgi:hypothetical protein